MPHLKLVFSPNALRGIQRAYRFIAERDEETAKVAAGTIRKQVAILRKFPNAGRPVDDLEPEHRELVIPFGVSGYLLIYEVHSNRLVVLAVRHQKEAGY